MSTKKVTHQYIKDLMNRDDTVGVVANLRGLLRIYQLQTDDEKAWESTSHLNSVGFSGVHAEILSSVVKQFINRGWITRKQYDKVVHRFMPRYWRQLYFIAVGKLNTTDIEKYIPTTPPAMWVRG
jgi:hypothetical protein